MNKPKLLTISLIIFVSSCSSLDTFKNKVRTEYNLSDEELYYVQYYVGGAIELIYIDIEAENKVGSQYEVKRNVTKREKEIFIGQKTPGILEKVGNRTLYISVDDNMILGFQSKGNNPSSDYMLTYINNQKVEEGSYVTIDELTYKVRFGTGERSFFPKDIIPVLKYKFSEKLKKIKDVKRVKGKRLD